MKSPRNGKKKVLCVELLFSQFLTYRGYRTACDKIQDPNDVTRLSHKFSYDIGDIEILR